MATAREKAAKIRKSMSDLAEKNPTVDLNATSNNGEAPGINAPDKMVQQAQDKPIVDNDDGRVFQSGSEPEASTNSELSLQEKYDAAVADKDNAVKNYSELRTHSDRVSSENSRLTNELNILLTKNVDVVPAEESKPETVEDITDQRGGETDAEYMQRLETAVAEYPEVAAPIVEAMNAKYNQLNTRMDGFEKTLNENIIPVVDATRDQTKVDVEKREADSTKRHFDEIAKAYPDYQAIANSEAFDSFLRGHPMGRIFSQTIFPDADKGERGGTAGEIIGVFNEFSGSQGNSLTNNSVALRQNAARDDSDGRIPSSQDAQESSGSAEAITAAQVEVWSKNPVLWNENKHKVYAAQSAGRIFN